MAKQVFRKGLMVMSLVFLSVFSLQSQSAPILGVAEGSSSLSKVLLMATLANGPAMRPVKWTVYRVKNGQSTKVDSFKRHSASIKLEPGIYRADAELNDVTRSRTFDIRTVTSSNVIVAMD